LHAAWHFVDCLPNLQSNSNVKVLIVENTLLMSKGDTTHYEICFLLHTVELVMLYFC